MGIIKIVKCVNPPKKGFVDKCR